MYRENWDSGNMLNLVYWTNGIRSPKNFAERRKIGYVFSWLCCVPSWEGWHFFFGFA